MEILFKNNINKSTLQCFIINIAVFLILLKSDSVMHQLKHLFIW